MCSDEEKAFYLNRMRSEGLTPFEAQRMWGSPSRTALSRWERQALAGELDVARVPVPPQLRPRQARPLPGGDEGRGPEAALRGQARPRGGPHARRAGQRGRQALGAGGGPGR